MEAVEIVFAQRLASGEQITRKRALKYLREHIKQESSKNTFTDDSLFRLCKGLHYALWMQDKMLLQEELADDICALTNLLASDKQIADFARALINTLSKEWPGIDRWRMDKFLMFNRRLIRTLFARLSVQHWDNTLINDLYMQLFCETLISSRSNVCESLKLHCVSLWLDEMDVAATAGEGFDGQKCLQFLQPYIKLLEENISDTFFRSICTDIFDAILHDFSEQLAERKIVDFEKQHSNLESGHDDFSDEDSGQEGRAKPSALVFDYEKLGHLLFEAGKQPHLPSKRRKRLYSLCKKFEDAAKGVDPLPPIPPMKEDGGQRRAKRKRKLQN